MIKFKWLYDNDKEIIWLNKLAEDGWAMTGMFLGFYSFEKVEKGKYKYQIDVSDSLFHVSRNYREFMQDMNIEVVDVWGPWVFLRKEAGDTEFELYTDIDSRIKHYTKIRNIFKVATIAEAVCAIMELLAAMNGFVWGYPLALLLLALMLIFANVAMKMNNIILDLKEKNGENTGGNMRRQMSAFTVVGMMLSSILLFIKDSWTVSEAIIIPFQVVAIILMVIGIYRTMKMRRGY